MKKLLNKTVRPIALFSLGILVLSIPAYFLIINGIWEDELDEHHFFTMNKVEKELNAYGDSMDVHEIVAQFNRLSFNSTITPATGMQTVKDSVYSHSRYDSLYGETETFRGFSSLILIHGKPYIFNTETSIEESEETIFSLAMVTFAFLAALILGIYFINRRLSKTVWKPFYSTLDKLKSFDLSATQGISFEKTDIHEFATLNESIGKLIEQDILIYQQQKEFTENASHELQTPLAILKTKIDLLLQDSSLTKEGLEKIAELNGPLSRAARINKNLLLLAKLDSQEIEETKQPVDIRQVTEELLSFLDVSIALKDIEVTRAYKSDLTVSADKNLVETLILNLLLNATKHNHEHGKMHVSLSGNMLQVSNSGTETLNAGTLFKRFVSSSKSSPGSGLGLAIVKEICARYGWLATYNYRDGMHSFCITF